METAIKTLLKGKLKKGTRSKKLVDNIIKAMKAHNILVPLNKEVCNIQMLAPNKVQILMPDGQTTPYLMIYPGDVIRIGA